MGEVSGLLTRAERAMVIANAVAASLGVLGFFVPIIDYSFQPILLWVITFSGLATGVLSLVYRSILIQALSDEKRTAVRDLSWFTTLINLIAHNIRTPLANISIRKDIALLKLAQGEAENVREDLEDMEKSLQTTSEILERFLKVSALSKSTHVRNVMDMGGFLNEYPSLKVRNNGVLYLTQSEKISLTLALEVFVDNALKYADSDVVVTISANGIVVRDFGSGIPDLEKGITEPKNLYQ
jgi:signal transduction histidine kinase